MLASSLKLGLVEVEAEECLLVVVVVGGGGPSDWAVGCRPSSDHAAHLLASGFFVQDDARDVL